MKKKLIASMAVVAAVAGVGVLAAGCGGDEFKNATTLNLADYEKEYNQYVSAPTTSNEIGSYDFDVESCTQIASVLTNTHYKGTFLKTVDANEVPSYSFNFHIDADAEIDVNTKFTLSSDVVVVGDDVYYTNSDLKVKTTITKLGQLNSASLSAEYLIAYAMTEIVNYDNFEFMGSAPVVDPAEKEEDNIYVIKQIKDDKNRKYLVESNMEDLDEEGYGEVIKGTMKFVYEDDKLVEYSIAQNYKSISAEETEEMSTSISVKKTSVTEIKAPANAADYTAAE